MELEVGVGGELLLADVASEHGHGGARVVRAVDQLGVVRVPGDDGIKIN